MAAKENNFIMRIQWDNSLDNKNICLNNTSEKGWMETVQLMGYFISRDHIRHISLRVIELANEDNIHIICLPHQSSQSLQPIDVYVYGHVKKS